MTNSFDIYDPFEEAFPIAIDAAKRFCRGNSDPNSACFTYHCLWPRLRRIGTNKSVWLHTANYIDTFQRLAKEGSRRVLVSGSADYSLIAHISHAFRTEGVEPEITVLDLCEAPLVVNRWYAKRRKLHITSMVKDLLQFESAKGFDIITTDNFLTRFEPAERNGVAAKWRELLQPSGIVVTAQRISNDPCNGRRALTEDEINRKLKKIREDAIQRGDALDISLDALILDATRYYRQRSYARMNSIGEVRRLFSANGYDVERVVDRKRQESDDHEPPRLSEHVFFVARKNRAVFPSSTPHHAS